MADDALDLARAVTEWHLDGTDTWKGAQDAVGDADGQEVRCGVDIGSGRWIVRAPGAGLRASELMVAEVVDLLPAKLPRGWAFNQTRGYVAVLGGELQRRAAASVVAEPGNRITEEQIFEAAERLARLAGELYEATMAPIKTAAQELRSTKDRPERSQAGQLGAGDPK